MYLKSKDQTTSMELFNVSEDLHIYINLILPTGLERSVVYYQSLLQFPVMLYIFIYMYTFFSHLIDVCRCFGAI